jgi:hypothetical protein
MCSYRILNIYLSFILTCIYVYLHMYDFFYGFRKDFSSGKGSVAKLNWETLLCAVPSSSVGKSQVLKILL